MPTSSLRMKKITLRSMILFSMIALGACKTQTQNNSNAIYQSDAYSVYPDSVVQGDFVAQVRSATELASTYQSPANAFQSPRITFKFAINGRDNEMKSGTDHYITCLSGDCETPIITFGEQYNDPQTVPSEAFLEEGTQLKVRLSMKPMLDAFAKQGYFVTPTGDKIYKEDFKGVYIAGGTDPLSWDFDNLGGKESAELKDTNNDGIYEITLTLNEKLEERQTAQQWKMSREVSAFPQYTSDYPISDALYNLALEEMINAVEPDSTFRTGKEWAGVWTRDISYSIILSMAQLQPQVSMYSLMRKVKDGRIVQDTGTGGAYPVSTDRTIWATAAWEVYKATGDEKWLRDTYTIISKSLDEDMLNAFDPETGLVRGESSFLDWREQTYPRWMQPADIYASKNLGTNAAHFQANRVAAMMAGKLGDQAAAAKYNKVAERIRDGINKYLWLEDKGYYGQFLYGRNYEILSPRAEALGEALAVIFGVADAERSATIVAHTPVTDFGVPSISPQIPGIPPYHNNGIWPFVQSYWSLAAAHTGNENALTESISAIYRPAALFLTNKENFVAANGDYAGTQINSSNMLWSLAGNLSMVYKVFFGMHFEADKLVLKPFVPKAFAGKRKLTNYTYRGATLTLEMNGYGNVIKSITLDGKALENAEIPANLTGKHTIKIELANNDTGGEVSHQQVYTSPEAPKVSLQQRTLSWPEVKGAVAYQVYKNGKQQERTTETKYTAAADAYAEYMVLAEDENGVTSFASEPLVVVPEKYKIVYEMEKFAPKSSFSAHDFVGSGFVEISKQKNINISMPITVPADGLYSIDFRYANGNGPINTSNKAAIRTLKLGDAFAGTIVLPQRGDGEWNNWGYTNAVQLQLSKGSHTLTLSFEPNNENMNGEVNQAMLDNLRLIKID